MISRVRPSWAIIAFWALSPAAHAFSFTASSPTVCDDLSISWIGGTPPFQLVMAPFFGTPRNVLVPSGSFSNGKGSFSFQNPFPEEQKFVITMSDATGYGTGGTTDVLTTGASKGGTCDTKDPGVDFSFELNTALQQCRPYIFSGYSDALQPITIIGTIPGGTSFVLNPPTGSASYSWNANVAAGTSILFTMIDSRGRNGGTSDVKTVGITDDSTCLNNLSPSSTAISSTSTSSATSSSTRTSPTSSHPPSQPSEPEEKTSIAAIAGTVIGALVFLAVTVTLGLFCLRKRRDSNHRHPRTELDLTYDPSHAPSNYPYPSGAAAASASPLPLMPSGGYDSNPFLDSPHPQQPYQQSDYGSSSSPYQPPSQYQAPGPYQASSQYQSSSQSQYTQPSHYQQRSLGSDSDPFNPYALSHVPPSAVIQPFDIDQSSSNDSMSTAQRKAALAGVSTYTPSRFIVHTDVEDELPPPNQDGVVELPPQYSERRGPPAGYAAASSSSNIPPLGS
ncbi:hypothetical protein D9615_001461 [Tricholomella constricta]|uniref:Uncharacterized protein n=1 Tax=Tricholomella constricta TaxID=117010 RepID=A0A8H5HKV1_9AGAR|nr:hypothetical protein D9615_001461 [Tricholomella constricta]